MTDDAELLEQVARDNSGELIDELYDRYAARIYVLGIRLLQDEVLAEELVQETFVRIWRKAPTFDPSTTPPSSFIYSIARDLVVEIWKRATNFSPSLLGSNESSMPYSTEQVIATLMVGDALEKLSPEQRVVLDLSFHEGLKQRDIAERLDLNLGTVKTRSLDALRHLESAVEEVIDV